MTPHTSSSPADMDAGPADSAATRARLRLVRELDGLRTMAGLTQRELAARTGIAQARISRILNGRRSITNHQITAWVQATRAPARLGQLLALNELAHTGTTTPATSATRIIASITLTIDHEDTPQILIQTSKAELTVTTPATVEHCRALIDQITGNALSDNDPTITLYETHDEQPPTGQEGTRR